MEKGLLEKTGKDLSHWKKVLLNSNVEKHGQMVSFLKSEHGFTHGFANFVALKTREADAGSHTEADLIANQYEGKENLFLIYQKLVAEIGQFGNDITISPKKEAVSFIRKRQFALVKPATKSRIDFGLKIKDKPTSERLEFSGPFGAMCTHRVRISEIEQIDIELLDWIKEAYEKAL
mgnify:CR=1 FL=1